MFHSSRQSNSSLHSKCVHMCSVNQFKSNLKANNKVYTSKCLTQLKNALIFLLFTLKTSIDILGYIQLIYRVTDLNIVLLFHCLKCLTWTVRSLIFMCNLLWQALNHKHHKVILQCDPLLCRSIKQMPHEWELGSVFRICTDWNEYCSILIQIGTLP